MTTIELLYRQSPAYLMAYQDGFRAGRDLAVSEMLAAIRKVAKEEGLTESSGTLSCIQEES